MRGGSGGGSGRLWVLNDHRNRVARCHPRRVVRGQGEAVRSCRAGSEQGGSSGPRGQRHRGPGRLLPEVADTCLRGCAQGHDGAHGDGLIRSCVGRWRTGRGEEEKLFVRVGALTRLVVSCDREVVRRAEAQIRVVEIDHTADGRRAERTHVLRGAVGARRRAAVETVAAERFGRRGPAQQHVIRRAGRRREKRQGEERADRAARKAAAICCAGPGHVHDRLAEQAQGQSCRGA